VTTSASNPGVNQPTPSQEADQSPGTSGRGRAVSIQRLDARQADAAAATLCEAFFDDPILQIVAPDEAIRRRWGPWFMSLMV